ncbi:6-phospho-alpha-glucosidase [Clostridium sp. CM028]|uniref:6-phospho-alpha-glucosidase n=1 Tax=unclassified Clostridium TaxID=2614128 RepID=UPI001C6F36A2|nr:MULTISPECIES: 6-phospho-alpha-glucosidase [unclassified Clostridium]MBW9146799.1 6-phospho-alpha-glucosidase [Clostridium sp. CM027]MBW9150180.1 6-phospho-alpha-glucosidase [Clostridium sp. CM028]UVE39722.1 6-phospho-alpha-glucosidase [Clostridium sp. CM027]WLC60424.1 6-phospho-alpha-glucosidase [Clostridium sp. CM028]
MKKFNVTLVGGGSTWTPGLLQSLCKMKETFPMNRLVLFDIDAQRQSIIGEFAKVLFSENYPELEFYYTTDVEEAYKDVDFVFMQMRTGGFKMREKDEKIPLSMGLVGQETCGAGGFAYGLRSIGDMINTINDIRKYSKDAWILNYTNPAAIVAEAVRRVFPDDKKILNMCDQPVNLLRSYGKILGMDSSEFEPVYFGLNHFGWFTHLFDKDGTDLAPKLRELICENGFKPVDAEQRDKSWLATYENVSKMLKDFPEYLPNTYLQYYLYPSEKVAHSDPNYTRANEVMDGRERKVFEECIRVTQVGTSRGSVLVHNDAHSEFMIEVAQSIAYNKQRIYIVITENNGVISNIQDDAMVEVAAVMTSNGPRPLAVGNISTFYKGLMEGQLAYEKLTVDAYMEGSYQKALQALTLNRTVVSAEKARKVLDALILANKGYWPELK